MDHHIQKSCWGTTAWAVAGFAFVMVVIYLTGMAGTADIVAATQN
jgi:hypothetical protein